MSEIERREKTAREAIRQSLGTEAGELGIDLFASHHLEELPPSYWQQQVGTTKPTAAATVDLLLLRGAWGEDDVENLDFTLPGDVTDYVVSVHFDAAGLVDGVSMES